MNKIPQVETLDAADNVWCVLYQQDFVDWLPLVNGLLKRVWNKLPKELKEEIRAIRGKEEM